MQIYRWFTANLIFDIINMVLNKVGVAFDERYIKGAWHTTS